MRRLSFLVALAGLFASPAFAQSTYPTAASGNPRVQGVVTLSCDATGANCAPTQTASAPSTAAADAQAASVTGSTVNARGYVFNGTTWDRQRGDTTGAYVVEVPSAAAAAGVTTVASAAVSGGQVIKASAGNLYGYNVVSGASAGYVLIFNSATVPADGAVTPVRCIPLAANTGVDVDLRGQPQRFSAGISIVFSTTGCYTKTASATAFIAGDAQ